MKQSILWHEDGDTAVITPQPGQKVRVELSPTHYAGPSDKVDNAIEIRPKE